jgi:hypothetical protein
VKVVCLEEEVTFKLRRSKEVKGWRGNEKENERGGGFKKYIYVFKKISKKNVR